MTHCRFPLCFGVGLAPGLNSGSGFGFGPGSGSGSGPGSGSGGLHNVYRLAHLYRRTSGSMDRAIGALPV